MAFIRGLLGFGQLVVESGIKPLAQASWNQFRGSRIVQHPFTQKTVIPTAQAVGTQALKAAATAVNLTGLFIGTFVRPLPKNNDPHIPPMQLLPHRAPTHQNPPSSAASRVGLVSHKAQVLAAQKVEDHTPPAETMRLARIASIFSSVTYLFGSAQSALQGVIQHRGTWDLFWDHNFIGPFFKRLWQGQESSLVGGNFNPLNWVAHPLNSTWTLLAGLTNGLLSIPTLFLNADFWRAVVTNKILTDAETAHLRSVIGPDIGKLADLGREKLHDELIKISQRAFPQFAHSAHERVVAGLLQAAETVLDTVIAPEEAALRLMDNLGQKVDIQSLFTALQTDVEELLQKHDALIQSLRSRTFANDQEERKAWKSALGKNWNPIIEIIAKGELYTGTEQNLTLNPVVRQYLIDKFHEVATILFPNGIPVSGGRLITRTIQTALSVGGEAIAHTQTVSAGLKRISEKAAPFLDLRASFDQQFVPLIPQYADKIAKKLGIPMHARPTDPYLVVIQNGQVMVCSELAEEAGIFAGMSQDQAAATNSAGTFTFKGVPLIEHCDLLIDQIEHTKVVRACGTHLQACGIRPGMSLEQARARFVPPNEGAVLTEYDLSAPFAEAHKEKLTLWRLAYPSAETLLTNLLSRPFTELPKKADRIIRHFIDRLSTTPRYLLNFLYGSAKVISWPFRKMASFFATRSLGLLGPEAFAQAVTKNAISYARSPAWSALALRAIDNLLAHLKTHGQAPHSVLGDVTKYAQATVNIAQEMIKPASPEAAAQANFAKEIENAQQMAKRKNPFLGNILLLPFKAILPKLFPSFENVPKSRFVRAGLWIARKSIVWSAWCLDTRPARFCIAQAFKCVGWGFRLAAKQGSITHQTHMLADFYTNHGHQALTQIIHEVQKDQGLVGTVHGILTQLLQQAGKLGLVDADLQRFKEIGGQSLPALLQESALVAGQVVLSFTNGRMVTEQQQDRTKPVLSKRIQPLKAFTLHQQIHAAEFSQKHLMELLKAAEAQATISNIAQKPAAFNRLKQQVTRLEEQLRALTTLLQNQLSGFTTKSAQLQVKLTGCQRAIASHTAGLKQMPSLITALESNPLAPATAELLQTRIPDLSDLLNTIISPLAQRIQKAAQQGIVPKTHPQYPRLQALQLLQAELLDAATQYQQLFVQDKEKPGSVAADDLSTHQEQLVLALQKCRLVMQEEVWVSQTNIPRFTEEMETLQELNDLIEQQKGALAHLIPAQPAEAPSFASMQRFLKDLRQALPTALQKGLMPCLENMRTQAAYCSSGYTAQARQRIATLEKRLAEVDQEMAKQQSARAGSIKNFIAKNADGAYLNADFKAAKEQHLHHIKLKHEMIQTVCPEGAIESVISQKISKMAFDFWLLCVTPKRQEYRKKVYATQAEEADTALAETVMTSRLSGYNQQLAVLANRREALEEQLAAAQLSLKNAETLNISWILEHDGRKLFDRAGHLASMLVFAMQPKQHPTALHQAALPLAAPRELAN